MNKRILKREKCLQKSGRKDLRHTTAIRMGKEMKEFRGSVAVILSNISTNDTSKTVSMVYSNYTKALHHRLANSGMRMFKNISNTIKLVRLSSKSLTAV